MSELKVGQTVEGKVRKVGTMGVFVDIGAKKKEGLIEVGEWLEEGGFPEDFQEAAKKMIGQRISARVLRVQGTNLFLTRRSGAIERPQLHKGQNKEEDIMSFAEVSPGKWFSGQVIGMAPWGVYVSFREWPGGRVQGLVHKSTFPDGFASEASIGQRVSVRIVSVDPAKKAIALSMRKPQ